MDIESIKDKILEKDAKKKVKFIMLFGSAISGTNNSLSDIDVAIYYDGDDKERFQFQLQIARGKLDVKIFQDLPLTVKNEVLKGKLLYYDDYDFMYDRCMEVIKEFRYFEKYYNEYLEVLRAET